MTRDEIIKGLEKEICRIHREPKRKMLGIFMTVDEAENIVALLKEQESVIEALKSDLDETLAVLGEYAEIVRCADCTFRNEINCPQYYRRNELPDDWFCADGERKDNG